ncbi:MAG TPA: 50S ribosomal protein L3 [Methanosarcinales archaeon]|nr:50S ribosomal protein L3 [Methanosarcinales archaeon]
MAKIHRPRHGSLAFSPRKRAKSEVPRFRSWPEEDGKEPKLQAFAGYKAGMTHIMMIDDMPHSLTKGSTISVPVTIVETPVMKVAAIRAYSKTSYGLKVIAEAWNDDLDADLNRAIIFPKNNNLEASLEKIEHKINEDLVKDIRVITYTLPKKITGVPKKKPDVMETRISGGNITERLEYAKSILKKPINIDDIFNQGILVDVSAITKGKGTQGPVKRWGVSMQKRKHARTGKLRHVGNLGPWRPARVRWTVPQLGQTGYHQRTEYNKRILKIGKNGIEVTPKGGFLNYGIVRNEYVMLKGSIPGPVKRLIRIRQAIRPYSELKSAPEIKYISLESKQGS